MVVNLKSAPKVQKHIHRGIPSAVFQAPEDGDMLISPVFRAPEDGNVLISAEGKVEGKRKKA